MTGCSDQMSHSLGAMPVCARPRRRPNRTQCQRGEIGRHDGFKIHCLHGRGGSSPPAGTTQSNKYI